MLRNNLGSDPGFTNFPLRSAWEGIAFTKDAFTELPVKILPVLQKLPTPLSLFHITALANKSLQPIDRLITSVATKVTILKNLFVD